MSNKYKEFKRWGKRGGEAKGLNNRKRLIDEVSRLTTDKGLLNFIMSCSNNDLIKEAIIELRKRDEKRTDTL